MFLGLMLFGSFGTSRYIHAIAAFGLLIAGSLTRSPRSMSDKEHRVGTSLRTASSPLISCAIWAAEELEASCAGCPG